MGRYGTSTRILTARADGGGLVVDVRPGERIEAEDEEAFAATARACELAGWSFRRVGAIDAVLLANVKWLAGYRHPRYHQDRVAAELVAVFAEPSMLLDGAERAGDRLAALPVLYHLLWRRVLEVELTPRPLGPRSVVRQRAGVR